MPKRHRQTNDEIFAGLLKFFAIVFYIPFALIILISYFLNLVDDIYQIC